MCHKFRECIHECMYIYIYMYTLFDGASVSPMHYFAITGWYCNICPINTHLGYYIYVLNMTIDPSEQS